MLTPRERFRRIYDFRSVDRPLRWEAVAFWAETVGRWKEEGGLPPDADPMVHYGFDPQPTVSGGLGFTSMQLSGPPVETEVVSEEGGRRICRNDLGQVWEERTDGTSMPRWVKFPVESGEDWREKIEPRLRPADHDYGNLEGELDNTRDSDGPRGLWLVGLYAFLRNFWGEQNLAYAFYDAPETLHEMGARWRRMLCECLPRLFGTVDFDYAMFHEDMAFKNGPLVGPNLYREFMTPYYRQVIAELRRRGVNRLMIDCDGNVEALMDCYVEIGINGLFPFEVAAGNDAFEMRRRYPNFVIYGAIDKRALLGGRDDVRRELDRVLLPLWETGGFIPSLDHAVPPCDQGNFEHYLETVRSTWR